MSKRPLFWEIFYLVVIVGVLNAVALHFFLYWKINEFDSIVHFSAGAAVSFAFLWLYFYSGFFNPQNRKLKNFIVVSILGIIFVGFVWEIYELSIGATSLSDPEYVGDTSFDILMDVLGALAACFYSYLRELKYSQTLTIK